MRLPSTSTGGRLKVLVVSPFLPYPLSHGGAVRIYNLCRSLAGRVDFILAAFRETHDVIDYSRLRQVFRQVHVVDIDEPASRDTSLPAQVREHQSRSLQALISELCVTERPDLLQVEYTHMAAFRTSAPSVPAILVEHDLTFTLYRQLAERNKAAQREYERWLAFERHWLSAYDAVWTVSDEDRLVATQHGSHPGRTFVVPNGVDIARFAPTEERSTALPQEVFYVGSFRHLPNILGFKKLLGEVMPHVWERLPKVQLRVIAGPDYERFWREFCREELEAGLDRRVVMHGFVQDLRPLYSRASVVVVPLEVSAGTNIKVLEAMACGKAVVTTPVGCAGLGLRDGSDAVVRSNGIDFAGSVCDLLSDAVLRRRIGAQARRTAHDRFSWTAIAEMAWQSYHAIRLSERRTSAP